MSEVTRIRTTSISDKMTGIFRRLVTWYDILTTFLLYFIRYGLSFGPCFISVSFTMDTNINGDDNVGNKF